MSAGPDKAVTLTLCAISQGAEGADARLTETLYERMRGRARQLLSKERPGHAFSPTVLVHEAYLRLTDGRLPPAQRSHFFHAAALAMRRILVDHARERDAAKRGGDRVRVGLTGVLSAAVADDQQDPIRLLALNEALDRLADFAPRAYRVVLYRVFGGYGMEEIADILDVTVRTVGRDWLTARDWLWQQFSERTDDAVKPEADTPDGSDEP